LNVLGDLGEASMRTPGPRGGVPQAWREAAAGAVGAVERVRRPALRPGTGARRPWSRSMAWTSGWRRLVWYCCWAGCSPAPRRSRRLGVAQDRGVGRQGVGGFPVMAGEPVGGRRATGGDGVLESRRGRTDPRDSHHRGGAADLAGGAAQVPAADCRAPPPASMAPGSPWGNANRGHHRPSHRWVAPRAMAASLAW